ncbi:MAG: DUF4157 domain-containing protein [Nitrospira sp.]|nr:DUF4157 domain-containing protein [Nitrospira sp.]
MPFTPVSRGVLQRKCVCGTHTMGGGQCAECQKKKLGVGGKLLQTKLAISEPGDVFEQEADRVAEQVMWMSPADVTRQQNGGRTQPLVQRRATAGVIGVGDVPPSVHEVLNSTGQLLKPALQQDMGQRFGYDFSQVRVHSGAAAAQSARDVNASAYAVGHNIVFGAGRFAPGTNEGQRLIAHELTHVVQQATGAPTIQRTVEVRPPGRGEASAFDRRQELVDRLNAISTGIQYRLDGRRIVYDVVDETALTTFDCHLRGFIDRGEVVPLRLITSAGRVQDGGRFVPLLIDNFDSGYLDLDDLLSSDDISFQLNLLHLLAERFRVPNYDRRIGTNFSQAEFDRAHRAGLDVEAELLRNVIGDPTIRFNFEETRPNGTNVFAFRSQEGYRVFHIFLRAGQERRGGEVFVRTSDGRRLTIDQLIAERAARVPVAP